MEKLRVYDDRITVTKWASSSASGGQRRQRRRRPRRTYALISVPDDALRRAGALEGFVGAAGQRSWPAQELFLAEMVLHR